MFLNQALKMVEHTGSFIADFGVIIGSYKTHQWHIGGKINFDYRSKVEMQRK